MRATYFAIMSWLTLRFVVGWLPAVRSAMDGPSYEWGTNWFGQSFSGAGLAGDYWFPVGYSALGLVTLYTGWRRIDTVFKPLVVAIAAVWLADAAYLSLVTPDALRFRGDTLGVDVSLGWFLLAASLLFFGLSAMWAAKAAPVPRVSFTRANWLILGTALAIVPFQFWLLATGEGQGMRDVAGVLLTIAQWILINLGLRRMGTPEPVMVAHERAS